MLQIHLIGKGFSGRGVRYQLLSSSQIDNVEKSATAAITKDSLVIEYQAARVRDGLMLMVKAVTTGPVAKGELDKASWRVFREGELEDEWENVFTPKDTSAMKRLYEEEHTVSKDELDEILSGKATVVD